MFFSNWISRLWGRPSGVGGHYWPVFNSSSQEPVNHDTALTVSTFFAGCRNVAEDIGKIPTIIYKYDGKGGKQEATGYQTYRLFKRAVSPIMGPMAFKESLTFFAMTWGNAYAEIQRNGNGQPVAMYPIHPARVEVLITPEYDLFYKVYPDYCVSGLSVKRSGEPIVMRSSDMFHLRGLGDGVCGMSVLGFAAETLGICIASQKFGGAFYGNGANAGGWLEHPAEISKAAAERLIESMESRHKGAGKSGKIGVLEEGMKFNKSSINPRDAQALELREFQVEEVARFIRVQPSKVGDTSNSTYSNIEQENINYTVDTLMSWSSRWEEEIINKLLTSENLTVEHNFNYLLRGDLSARTGFYQTMQFSGVLSVNEIRAFEGLNPIGPEGDVHYIQSSMIPLGDTENEGSTGRVEGIDNRIGQDPTASIPIDFIEGFKYD
jgi:HK97 family phage portal protein